MDRGAWQATVHGIAKSWTRLSDFTFTLFNLYAEYIMRNTGLDEAKLESRLLGEISIASDVQKTPPSQQNLKWN